MDDTAPSLVLSFLVVAVQSGVVDTRMSLAKAYDRHTNSKELAVLSANNSLATSIDSGPMAATFSLYHVGFDSLIWCNSSKQSVDDGALVLHWAKAPDKDQSFLVLDNAVVDVDDDGDVL